MESEPGEAAYVVTHSPSMNGAGNGLSEVPVEAAVKVLPFDCYHVKQTDYGGEIHGEGHYDRVIEDRDNRGRLDGNAIGILSDYDTFLRGGGFPRVCMKNLDGDLPGDIIYLPRTVYMDTREDEVKLMYEVDGGSRRIAEKDITEIVGDEEWYKTVNECLEGRQPGKALDIAQRLDHERAEKQFASRLTELLNSKADPDIPESVWNRIGVSPGAYRLSKARELQNNFL